MKKIIYYRSQYGCFYDKDSYFEDAYITTNGIADKDLTEILAGCGTIYLWEDGTSRLLSEMRISITLDKFLYYLVEFDDKKMKGIEVWHGNDIMEI